MNPDPSPPDLLAEAARRRTFAIISHPDAGKTTLTEKFLLYAGAVQRGRRGARPARGAARRPRTGWSSSSSAASRSRSTVLQFPYRDHVVNLLDTPGHRDFSEDTYRVLAAVDAAVMVLDAAKGIEPQTLKLFEVCRDRGLPVLTFLNKYDRPGREPLELLDEIEAADRAAPDAGHVAGRHRRRLPRRDRPAHRRRSSASPATDRGASRGPEEIVAHRASPRPRRAPAWQTAADEIGAARRRRRRRRPAVVPRR